MEPEEKMKISQEDLENLDAHDQFNKIAIKTGIEIMNTFEKDYPEEKTMKLKELSDNRLYAAIALGVALFFLLGMLVGYYIGLNIAEGFYLPKLENCFISPW